MIIQINKDGSVWIGTDDYTAYYDKEGKPKMIIGDAAQHLTIHNAFKPKAEKAKTYDAGMTLSAEIDIKASITCDDLKVFNAAKEAFIKSATIDSAKITNSDDHIRRMIRNELKTLITEEIRPGGLLARR